MRRRAHVLAPARAAGFTLVELVVALSMVTVMTVLLFSGLRLGARVWDTVEQRTDTRHERHRRARGSMREREQARPRTGAPRDGEKRLAGLEPVLVRYDPAVGQVSSPRLDVPGFGAPGIPLNERGTAYHRR